MARKGENIYKRKDGRWEGRYRMNNPADGRKRYCSVYGKTYKEVKEKLFIRKREHLSLIHISAGIPYPGGAGNLLNGEGRRRAGRNS